MRNRALEESKAPVSRARIEPEYWGKVLLSWKDGMNTNGPPRARKRYPGMYASKGILWAKANSSDPMLREIAPMMLLTRGPKRSSMVPTGRAATFVDTAAIVNMRFSLKRYQRVDLLAQKVQY